MSLPGTYTTGTESKVLEEDSTDVGEVPYKIPDLELDGYRTGGKPSSDGERGRDGTDTLTEVGRVIQVSGPSI